jgi:hypothetical protein
MDLRVNSAIAKISLQVNSLYLYKINALGGNAHAGHSLAMSLSKGYLLLINY